jgi:hypothetical protein
VTHASDDVQYWARDYWLEHCEGFRVDDARRRLGVVEEVLGEEGEPEEIVVRGGLFANRSYRIPVDAVERVEPSACRILLRMDRDTS